MDHDGFFIVGAPRSGTTLLQTMLAEHPLIYSAPETSFFNRTIPMLGAGFSTPSETVAGRQIAAVREDFEYMTGIALDIDDTALEGSNVQTLFESIMESFNVDEKQFWIEKTTNHARCMTLIHRFYPSAKFVHIIRDPVDSIGSMVSISPTGLDDFRIRYVSPIAGFARVWLKCVRSAFSFPFQDQVRHIYYEDLVQQPQETVRSICDFFDIEYSEDMLSNFERQSSKLFSVDRCPWQSSNADPGIRSQAVGKGRRTLNRGDIWLIQRVVREAALELGYYDASETASIFDKIRSTLLEVGRYAIYATYLEFPVRRALRAMGK